MDRMRLERSCAFHAPPTCKPRARALCLRAYPIEDFVQRCRRRMQRQVADVEVSGSHIQQRAHGPRTDIDGGCAGVELARQSVDRSEEHTSELQSRLHL